MIRRSLLGAVLAAVLAPSAFALTPALAPARVTEAWLREAPPGATAMAGYMNVAGNGRDVVLTKITSPLFHHVEMHVLETDADGLVEMREVPSFAIKATGKLALRPGGPHLMLIAPKRTLRVGEKVPLTLEFGKAGRVVVSAPVKRPGRE